MRLIDADALIETKRTEEEKFGKPKWQKGHPCYAELTFTESEIDNAPTVEERKHGHWIDDGTECVTCSVCGIEVDYHYGGYKYSPDCGYEYVECKNYCGNCGAIMNEVME